MVSTPTVDLQGRSAVVTGAASGIGRAVAGALGKAGARVSCVDLDVQAARRTAEEIGNGAAAYGCDLSDLAAVDRLGDRIAGCDILVNNAGVQHVAPVHEFPPERFSFILRLMLEAPFRLSRAVLPAMRSAGWGRLIHVSSVHGLRASPHKVAYVAAKHGLEGMSKTIALENGDTGVTSVCLSPGFVRTPLVEGQIAGQAAATGLPPDRVMDEVILKRPAVKELVEPATVGAMALFLASEHGRLITGVSLTADGGWSAS